jgi:hypothetical protein
VFAVTKTSVYMRDVLDSLVLATSSGVSQRIAYDVQRSYMESATLRYPRDEGMGKLWERYKTKDRRGVPTALSIYVPMLDSAFGSNVECSYNCSNCQYRDEEGNWQWRGVCINGTATGVRGDLLDQYKDTVRAKALPNTYRAEQFLLRKQADRAAAVCIGHALQKLAADDEAGLWKERDLDVADKSSKRCGKASQLSALLSTIEDLLRPQVTDASNDDDELGELDLGLGIALTPGAGHEAGRLERLRQGLRRQHRKSRAKQACRAVLRLFIAPLVSFGAGAGAGTPGTSMGRAATAKMRRLAKASRLNRATCGRKTLLTTTMPNYTGWPTVTVSRW